MTSFVNVRLHFSSSFRCWKTADGEYITSFCFCLSSSARTIILFILDSCAIQIFPQLVLRSARALRHFNRGSICIQYTLSSIFIYLVLVKFVNNSSVKTNQWAVFESQVHLCKPQCKSTGVEELSVSFINF